MPDKRRGPKQDEPPSVLAAALRPHVDELAAAAAERVAQLAAEAQAEAERARLRRLDEGALMRLIFAHLDDDNPRVCVGIDFDRIVVLERVDAPRPASATQAPPAGNEPSEPSDASPPSPPFVRLPVQGHALVGRGWVDEVRAIDPALLDRPELDADARALVERARGRNLPCVNLRRLEREPALRHLELFVAACREQRVRYVRVITGKGIESRAEPVLKRAVLGWCLDARLTGVPELDEHGEWGALIVDLRA